MATHPGLEATVQAALDLYGFDAATIERSPSATIVPAPRSLDTAGERALELLGRLDERRHRPTTAAGGQLELHGTIGEGGMGIVRLGTQHSLGREVAVKTLKSEHRDEASTLKLLREAWVTGGLEHPNVVPVYDIALEEDGTPLIVLKRIEGDEWASLMHDAAAIRKRFGADDALEWNLRILMQVCNAVHFAHSRHIMHRDLKPENVMIGSFGEVYVVDWGIALSLAEDRDSWLPLASDARELAGTPVYMAPEMLGGVTSRLSQRTDVYLLGAILYEILTGEAPHRGENFMEMVASIVESRPPLEEDVPEELARIIRRAMDADPDARFENAEQVRLALSGFLQHRDAMRLADRAEAHLAELGGLLETTAASSEVPEVREAVYDRFGEARFGFRHALEVWAGHEEARAGLDRATTLMVEYELAQGEPEAARTLLAELSLVPEELAARVDQARRAREAADAELRRVQADHDPAAGRRTRGFLSLVVGALWVILPFLCAVSVEAGWVVPTHTLTIGYASGFVVFLAGLGIWARESMFRTAINRQVGWAGILAMGVVLVVAFIGMIKGVDPLPALHPAFLAYATMLFLLTSSLDVRLLPSAIVYLAGYVVAETLGYTLFVAAASNVCLLLNMSLLWSEWADVSVAHARIKQGRAARRARLRQWLGKACRSPGSGGPLAVGVDDADGAPPVAKALREE